MDTPFFLNLLKLLIEVNIDMLGIKVGQTATDI
jgi:hypothetical protein